MNIDELDEWIKKEKIKVDSPDVYGKIVLSKGVLKAKRIYLERIQTDSPKDTGWFIGFAEKEKNKGNYEAIWVGDLIKLRSKLLSILQLPAGYMVIVDGDKIDYIDYLDNGKNISVYKNSDVERKL